MFKKMVLIVVVMAALLAFASPAKAHGAAITLYVDKAYTGIELGTPTQPFNTIDEAVAMAQAQPYGGDIWTMGPDGLWWFYGWIAPINPPITGSNLSGPALFAVLVGISILLIAGGWFLMRRSRARARLA